MEVCLLNGCVSSSGLSNGGGGDAPAGPPRHEEEGEAKLARGAVLRRLDGTAALKECTRVVLAPQPHAVEVEIDIVRHGLGLDVLQLRERQLGLGAKLLPEACAWPVRREAREGEAK